MLVPKGGTNVLQSLRIKTVNYRGRMAVFFIVREGLNSSFMDDFGDTIGG